MKVRRYRFAVKAVEHAQVRLGPSTVILPAFGLCPTDVLEPAGENPSARVEAYKVNQTENKIKKRHLPHGLRVLRYWG